MASPEFVKGIDTGHSQCRRVGANYIDVRRRRLRLQVGTILCTYILKREDIAFRSRYYRYVIYVIPVCRI